MQIGAIGAIGANRCNRCNRCHKMQIGVIGAIGATRCNRCNLRVVSCTGSRFAVQIAIQFHCSNWRQSSDFALL